MAANLKASSLESTPWAAPGKKDEPYEAEKKSAHTGIIFRQYSSEAILEFRGEGVTEGGGGGGARKSC